MPKKFVVRAANGMSASAGGGRQKVIVGVKGSGYARKKVAGLGRVYVDQGGQGGQGGQGDQGGQGTHGSQGGQGSQWTGPLYKRPDVVDWVLRTKLSYTAIGHICTTDAATARNRFLRKGMTVLEQFEYADNQGRFSASTLLERSGLPAVWDGVTGLGDQGREQTNAQPPPEKVPPTSYRGLSSPERIVDKNVGPVESARQQQEKLHVGLHVTTNKAGEEDRAPGYHRGLGREPNRNKLSEANLRKEMAMAELRELELDLKRGELVPVSLQQEVWADVGGMLKEALLAMPDKLSQLIEDKADGDTVRVVIDSYVRQVLGELPGKLVVRDLLEA